MTNLVLSLYIIGPVFGIIYKTLDYFSLLNWLTGHKKVMEALERLESTSGYPKSWLYDDDEDKGHFNAIIKIINRKTKEEKIKKVLREGYAPSMVTVGGDPIPINGIPEDWPQEKRFYFSDNHPVILSFNVSRNSNSKGKGDKVCTLGELRKWVSNNKKKYDYIIGGLVIGIIAIATILFRLNMTG